MAIVCQSERFSLAIVWESSALASEFVKAVGGRFTNIPAAKL